MTVCTFAVLASSCGLFGSGQPAPGPPKPPPIPVPAPPPGEAIDAAQLTSALESLAPPTLEGITAARLLYTRGPDRVASDCDLEFAGGRAIAIVVRDSLPTQVVGFANADRVGEAWVLGPLAEQSAEWPVDPTTDLDRASALLAWLPRLLKLASHTLSGSPRGLRDAGMLWTRIGDVDVGVEGDPLTVVAIRTASDAGTGKRSAAETLRLVHDEVSLSLHAGTGVIVLGPLMSGERALARVEIDAAGPGGVRFALERIAPAEGRVPTSGDQMRSVMNAHRAALDAREGIAAAAAAMVRTFGPWVGAKLLEPVRAEADAMLREGKLAAALDPLLDIARGLDPAALTAQADAAEAQGFALEALARTLAAQGAPPRADLAWTAARRMLAVAAIAPGPSRRALRGRALELLALASNHEPDHARALALARALLEAGEADLSGDIAARIGSMPEVDAGTQDELTARRTELHGRIVEDLHAHRADLGRDVLDALDTAIRVRPERAMTRLLAARTGPIAPLQSHLRELLSWTLPDRGSDELLELASALGAVLASAAPSVELDASEQGALAAQLGTEVPELYEAVLARHLPSLSSDARARARRDLAGRLSAEAANPLFPWRKHPVGGLVVRLRTLIEADPAALASPARLERVLRRRWAELESASSPWILARTDDDRASLSRYLILAGATP